MSDRRKITIKKKGDQPTSVTRNQPEPPPKIASNQPEPPPKIASNQPEPTQTDQKSQSETPTPPIKEKREIGRYLKARQAKMQEDLAKEAKGAVEEEVPQKPVVETIKEPLREPARDRVTEQAANQPYDDFEKPLPLLKIGLISSGVIALIAVAYFFILPLFTSTDQGSKQSVQNTEVNNTTTDKNGFYIKDMLPEGSEKIEDILSSNTSLRQLMTKIGVPNSDVNALEREGNKYAISRLRPGDKYTLAHELDNPSELRMLMIEPKTEPYTFYKIDLGTSLTIEKLDKQVELRENYIAAIVEGTLGQTFIDNNLNLKLISTIEGVLAWTVDLFDVGDGDRFKVLYDEEFVNGRSYRIDKIKALYFEKDGKPYFAFNHTEGDGGFFNEFGQSMKKSFLATPIKYGGVITSGFGLRTHPITGHTKEHLGTDFAAPEGTPIQAVADGTITIATFKGNNGNYVKMRHDKIYETQYLHMKEFAQGIRPGTRVKQGDVIGYVGSTGLSSGPHVCYRFWKDKKQVSPMNENSGSGTRIPAKSMEKYYGSIESIKEKLMDINYF